MPDSMKSYGVEVAGEVAEGCQSGTGVAVTNTN
jgi:hypothetical protein